MCLTVAKKENGPVAFYRSKSSANRKANNPLIAKKAIKVYKRFDLVGKSKQLESPFQGFRYVKGKLYSVKSFVFGFEDDWIHSRNNTIDGFNIYVNEGLHSYVAPKLAYTGTVATVVIECTIPKGAKYFYGKNGDIVSNKLKIGKKPWDFDKIKIN